MLNKSILSTALKLNHAGESFAFDMRELFNSAGTEVLISLADQLWSKIKNLTPEVIFGKGIGSYPLLIAIKMRAYELDKINLTILFVRDQKKQTGSFKKEIEGSLPRAVDNKKSVFIDDIYNSGGTFEETKKTLFDNDFNLEVVGIAVVVDFFNHSRVLRATRYPFYNITSLIELGLSRRDAGVPKALSAQRWGILDHHSGIYQKPVKSVAVIYNKNIYIGNDNTNQYCFDLATGDLRWLHKSSRVSLKGTAGTAAFDNGLVYWSSYDGTLTCAKADNGQVLWKSKLDTNLHSSPCLDIEGKRIFIATEFDKQLNYGRGDIVCVDLSSGDEVWRTPTDGMAPSTPLYIKSKNLVVCGSNDFNVYFLDATNGSIVVKLATYGEVKGKAAYSEEHDLVVFTSNFGEVYAFCFKTKKIKWQRKIGDSSISGLPIIDGSSLFTTNSAGFVISLDILSGLVNWVARLRGQIHCSLIEVSSKLIVGTTDGYVVSLDKKTGTKLTSDKIDGLSIFQPVAYCSETNSLVVTGNKEIFCYDAQF